MSQVDNFDKDIQDVQTGANPEQTNQSETTDQTTQEAEPGVDWKDKFVNSQKGALELLEQKKRLEKEIEDLRTNKGMADHQETDDQTMENLYPGFSEMDPEAQANLVAFSRAIRQEAINEITKQPEIAFAKRQYNERVWDSAFDSVAAMYPELASDKEAFKNKYFDANNVPVNINDVLPEVAKIYLFDKAQEQAKTQGEQDRESRVDTERNTGGSRDVSTTRTLSDWQRMMQENPAKFAKLSKEYHADLASGKLKE